MKFWAILQIGGYVLGWLERSARDGKITMAELVDLLTNVATIAGLKFELDVPHPPEALN